MKKLLLKVISLMVVISMMAPLGITVSAANEYPDDGYWANEAINAAIANGLLRGKEDGKIHSEDNLTRSEMAAIMVRAFGATVKGDISKFKDLEPSAWYYDEFSKAVQMRVFEGDGSGRMRPNDPITREEVFTVVARAMVLKNSDHSALNKFKDSDKISGWALDYMSVLAEKSYVNGDNIGNVNPKKNITRAEFAQLMHNIFRNYYSKADTYKGKTDSRSSMINTGNVTFKNVTINNDLVIGDGDAKGTIRLENVNIKGRLLVRGSNRVELVKTTVGEMVVVNNYNTVVHFDNYRDEKVFDGIVLNTQATFKKKASSGGGGGGGSTKKEYNTVTFYYKTNVVGTATVEKGSTVSDAQFPDYSMTYDDGHVKDTSVSPVYTTPYKHTVNYGWWYNVEADKWEEFTNETVVNSNMDVYLKISKFNAIVTLATGEQFNFYAFYESGTRFTDTVKDILYNRGPLEALKLSGYWDKLRENGRIQKLLDEDDNIMMLSYMIRFSQILGEENIEKFIIDNAKDMFAGGSNETLHDAFVEYIIAVSNSTDENEKKKIHGLMKKTINNVFEGDEISTETLALIRDLCDDALSNPDTFKEVTGYDYNSLPTDTKTFVINYIIDQLVKNDALFASVVKEVTGVDYTATTTTKDLIIAMAKKQLNDNYVSTIDSIKDTQKSLIVATVKSMLNDDSNGMYDEVLTYAKENEKATIVATIKTLLAQEDGLYNEVVNFIVGDATYKPMLINTISSLLADDTSSMYGDVMNIVSANASYRAIVAEEIGNKLATDDALFEALTGCDPAFIPNRAAVINNLKVEITNNQSSFETAIANAEAAGYKTFITDSIIDEIETNNTFFNSVFAEAKNSYRSEIVDTVSTELGKTANGSLFDEVVDYAKDDYKSTIVDVMVDKLEEDNSPMYTKVIDLAKTDAYKATITNAIIDKMNGTDGDSLISAITGCTAEELAKDPQAKDGYIMGKAEELLNDNDYFASVIESITGDADYVLPATPKDFIIDLVLMELMDTESTSPTRDLIIEKAIEYLLEGQDEEDISHLADYAIDYLGKHPEERDALVDQIINEVYKDDLDKLVYQLINEDQFEVDADTVFVAKGLKSVLLEDYNYETFFGSKIPGSLEKLFEIYPEEKVKELYDFALNSLIAQIDQAIVDAGAGGTGYIDCGITPVVNIMSDVYVPLHESLTKILEDKAGDKYYYSQNIYLQELVKLLDPTVWVQGSANAKPNDKTGYKIHDLDYYYDLYYKIYVLSDDAMLWYYNNLDEPEYEKVMENYEELILKYVNVIADKLDVYVVDGEIPKINDMVDDKISAVEKALVEKYPDLVKGMLDMYKGSEFFNKEYGSVDYEKVHDKVYNTFVRTLNLTTDEYFDLILNQEAMEDLENKAKDKIQDKLDGKLDGEYYTKIDDNTYEFEVNGYKIRFIRELKNTLY